MDLFDPRNLNPAPPEKRIWTVNHLNLEAQGLLEGSFPMVWVEGELSNLSRPSSGHLYFSLKDEQAQISGAMFRGSARTLRFAPKDGMQVLVRARVTLYVPRGGFQLVVEHMEEAGEGRLRREFEQLREKLRLEGLFEDSRKQSLPAFPRCIGVISSPSGAAVHDILTVLKRRCPSIPVLIYPSAVQGKEAPAQLRAALELANLRDECDVLILARGGGSLEDLWAFNDETLARTVAASRIPVISAVGHEVDFSLTDYVADKRAATPSQAAELVSPDMSGALERTHTLARRLSRYMQQLLLQHQRQLEQLEKRLEHPEKKLQTFAQRTDELEQRLKRVMQNNLQFTRQRVSHLQQRFRQQSPEHLLPLLQQRLEHLQKRLPKPVPQLIGQHQRDFKQLVSRLNSVNPLTVVERGYSITKKDGKPIKSIAKLQPGDVLETQLQDGTILSQVSTVSKKP